MHFSYHFPRDWFSHRELRPQPSPRYDPARAPPCHRPLYRARGFNVVDVHADNEFMCVKEEFRPIHMDIVPADRHVGEIERSVKTVKERLRSTVHGLAFKRTPKLLVRHIVADAVRCLNQFPWANGISAHTSPLSPKARSLGAIALTPTGNANGDYYFLSLATGARISRHQWTAIPITDTCIARVEVLAKHERQPLLQARGRLVMSTTTNMT